ncbi:hypothetical protein BB561_006665 [Smittium simulii]|uniref:Uncharacterized protein n=1 Tax=Smittium simulii TaxID=133385 RepID=A0A2T9Y2H1_9FUNG|nr:hypothetical protein BB561_006665 [Smittium simulii]
MPNNEANEKPDEGIISDSSADEYSNNREKRKKEFTETDSNKIPRYENIVSIGHKYCSQLKHPIFEEKIYNAKVKLLLDSGATTYFIAEKLVQKLNI